MKTISVMTFQIKFRFKFKSILDLNLKWVSMVSNKFELREL